MLLLAKTVAKKESRSSQPSIRGDSLKLLICLHVLLRNAESFRLFIYLLILNGGSILTIFYQILTVILQVSFALLIL